MPTAEELVQRPEERADRSVITPIAPSRALSTANPDRVLLKAVHSCPVYCASASAAKWSALTATALWLAKRSKRHLPISTTIPKFGK